MSCCYERMFNKRMARGDARKYRRSGLGDVSRRMVEFARGSDSVLDIGGGIGALALELVKDGAERATVVELSHGYDAVAEELRAEAGIEPERLERRIVDILAEPDAVGPADAVLMNRVVCCHPDVDGLVGAAADRAERRLVLSFPRDRWLTLAARAGINGAMRLLRREFRFFVHEPARIAAAAQARGLAPAFEHRGRVWQIAGFERTVSA